MTQFPRESETPELRMARLVRGRGRFVDDVQLPGTLHLGIVRSLYAHANLKEVDVSSLKNKAGVIRALTGREAKGLAGASRLAPPPGAKTGWKFIETYALASDKVLYVGEPVAAVLCESAEACEDAIDLVKVEYEALPAVVDAEEAASEGSPLLYPGVGSNVLHTQEASRAWSDGAFDDADRVIELRFHLPRQAAAPIEPRGVVASFDEKSRILKLYSQTKVPFATRKTLAELLRLDEVSIQVETADVGGNFGVKARVYPEDVLACALSIETGRPVKWISTRREDLLATWQGRGQSHTVKVGFTRRGKIVAMRDDFVVDVGAAWSSNLVSFGRTIGLLTGCYRIPRFFIRARCVATNKAPFGPVRGNGRPEALFVIERVMDRVARELGLDPIEVRRANLIPRNQMPYTTGTGTVYDGGDYPAALRKMLRLAKLQHLRQWQDSERKRGRRIGIGFSCYVEDTADKGYETAAIRLAEDGKIIVTTGASPSGQGIERAVAKVVARELGVVPNVVQVEWGMTDRLPDGVGTFGSRSAILAGNAAKVAAAELRKKFFKKKRRTPVGRVELARIAARSLKEGRGGGELTASGKYQVDAPTFSFGAHVAVVDVDPETFESKLLEYYALDDAGRVLDPESVEGQIEGGVMNGIGNALLEEIRYDASGQLLTSTFADYLIPSPASSVKIRAEVTETRSRLNPLGVRGVGEGGTIAALPAVIGAVEDALAEKGAKILSVPASPHRLWEAVREALPAH
jgi:carbon-monoxide dehydrogenase large subunit